MDIFVFATIAAASAINAAIPGPCVALTVGRSACDGPRAGLFVSVGVLAADLVLVTAALSIMVGTLAVSRDVFMAMKWIGVAVLIVLAMQMLANRHAGCEIGASPGDRLLCDAAAGLIAGLSSPINLVFLMALLPQLVPASSFTMSGMALAAAAFAVGCAAAQLGATLIGSAAHDLSSSAPRWIERAGAVSLIGFAGAAAITPIA